MLWFMEEMLTLIESFKPVKILEKLILLKGMIAWLPVY